MDGTDKERVLHDEIRRDMVISKIELRRKHLRHMHINKEMLQDSTMEMISCPFWEISRAGHLF